MWGEMQILFLSFSSFFFLSVWLIAGQVLPIFLLDLTFQNLFDLQRRGQASRCTHPTPVGVSVSEVHASQSANRC